MKAKQIFILSIVLLAAISLSKIRYADDVYPGQFFDLYASVLNSQGKNAEDVRVVVDFPEMGYVYNSGRFDVEDNEHYSKVNTIYMPGEIAPGEYLVRITASNDDHTTRKFRYIIVE